MKNPYRNNRLIIPVFLTLLIIWVIVVYASSNGIIGRTPLSNNPGCTCHNSSPTTGVTVSISGPNELEINQTGSYTVTIQGGPLSAAGINIAKNSGTLANIDGSLKLSSDELTHTSPKTPSNNAVTFDFQYTAPANPGEAIIAATGNSVNLLGNSSGDAWNFADSFAITINTTTNIAVVKKKLPKIFELRQNYPNPFNPKTTISYTVGAYHDTPLQKVNLTIFNILGEKITILVSEFQPAGDYSVNFDGSNLESGTYFYVLSVDGQSQSRRMLLLK